MNAPRAPLDPRLTEQRNPDTVEIDLEAGRIMDVTTGKSWQAKPLPPFMRELIEAGGLVNYAKGKLGS